MLARKERNFIPIIVNNQIMPIDNLDKDSFCKVNTAD